MAVTNSTALHHDDQYDMTYSRDDGGAATVIVATYVVPSILIAVSSAIVNFALPSHRHTERVLGQVGILICATFLSSQAAANYADNARADNGRNSNDIASVEHGVLIVAVHVTIFLNLSCAALSASVSSASTHNRRTNINTSNTRTSILSRSCHSRCFISIESAMSSLALASLGPVIAYSIQVIRILLMSPDQTHTHTGSDINIFVLSFVIALLLIQIVKRVAAVRKRRADVLAGIPMVSIAGYHQSGSPPPPPPRPDRWYEWSVDEVAQWISSFPSRQRGAGCSDTYASSFNDNVSSTSNNHTSIVLREEQVDGPALATLSIETLRSFGLAYGDAATLKRRIDEELIELHGTGNLRLPFNNINPYQRQADGGFVDAEQWLKHVRAGTDAHDNSIGLEEDPMQMSEKANEVFSQRFGGMKLAQFQTASSAALSAKNDDTVRDTVAAPRREAGSSEMEMTAAVARMKGDAAKRDSSNPADPSLPPLDNALLASMPPDVREVAFRRPDLVRRLLLNRQNNCNNNPNNDEVEMPMSQLMETTTTTARKQQQQQQAPQLLSQVQRAMMAAKPSYAARYAGAQAAAEISGVEFATSSSGEAGSVSADIDNDYEAGGQQQALMWSNDDEESSDTVGLLRRRSSPKPYR